MTSELEQRQREEAAAQERVQSIERQAQEAEKALSEQTDIPKASMLNFKSVLEIALEKIEQQKKALADRSILTRKNEKQQEEIHSLRETVTALNEKYLRSEKERLEEKERISAKLMEQMKTNSNLSARLEETEKFFRWNTDASIMRDEYEREQRQEAQRKAAEQKRLAQEREQQERQRQEEQQRREAELTREKEAQQLERERERERQRERRPRGMGMGR